jgi:hypothetical protein
MTPNGEAALRLAEFGFRVFPLWENSKKPFLDKWQIKACTDPGIISAWYRSSNHNIGLATGADSGCIVFDWDGPQGFGVRNMLAAKYGPLPLTVTVKTGKGEHGYFRHPGEIVRNKQNQPLFPGWDLRGDGGYVVAPPSRHPNGHTYEWIRSPWEYDLQDLPEAYLDLIIKPPPVEPGQPKQATPPSVHCARLEAHNQDSARDSLILSMCGYYVRRYSDPDIVRYTMYALNDARNHPPLSRQRVDDICNEIANREAQRIMRET